ncbi:hypothetical protein BURPS305_7389 [Burkholderia pseudomallei 305]|nr:hypothetical protein BPC006_I2759 [Burkholderia pseudomallei BPC006]EBA51197.1 hypothetical protein BURPS305_7389 [Burkholderia pseudomallei 305]
MVHAAAGRGVVRAKRSTGGHCAAARAAARRSARRRAPESC